MVRNNDRGSNMVEKYYRYQEFRYSHGVDQFDDPLPGYDLRVNLLTFGVVKKTPKGVWICQTIDTGVFMGIHGIKKFILNSARKKYACPTKADAINAFLARKLRQRKIVKKLLEDIEMSISQANIIQSGV